MPNSVKKNKLPQETDAAPEAGMDDFDLQSLDDLATFMVEALTLPLPTDFRNADGSAIDRLDAPAPPSSKRFN